MTPAFWGDDLMTEFLLHGTQRKYVANIRKYGLKAGGGCFGGPWKDRAFIFCVPERPDTHDHPLLRHNTD